MPNHIALVEQLRKDINFGVPTIDGPAEKAESILRRLPYLLRRIDELEAALRPIAHYYDAGKNMNSPILPINKSDGQRAFDAMDPNQSYDVGKKKQYEYPAR